MYFVSCEHKSGKKVLINPKDIRWIAENENNTARIEFLNGEQQEIICEDFDELEQKFLDASLPEIDLKSCDGIKIYVTKEDK